MPVDERILRRLKLSDLRLFQAVVDRGGMAKAAASLNISQPAVSKAIASLEATLRVRLLDRNPHGVEPTVFGRALLDGGIAVFDELIKSVKQIEYLADPTGGEVSIGCTEAGAAGFVPTVIARLSQDYPRAVFRVTTADAAALVSRELPQRRIELAIGAVPDVVLHKDIEAAALFEDRHFVMAGETNKWVRRRKIKLSQLINEPWILPPPDSPMGFSISEAFRSNGLEPPQSRVISYSIPLCHHLIATGRFLTMHPIVMARLGNHLPLRRLDVEFTGVRRRVSIMTLRNRTLSPLARLVIDCARDMAKSLAKSSVGRRMERRILARTIEEIERRQ
jgi:DNA-binding transcriptional LysR family regulator